MVEIIHKINDLLNQDFDLIIELEIVYNYLLEQDHVYEIQFILNHDPILTKKKLIVQFIY